MRLPRLVHALLALVPLLALFTTSRPGSATAQAPDTQFKVYLPLVGTPLDFPSDQPQPVSVNIVTDPTATTATIDAETGGVVTATGSNGATYTLEIPADALVVDTIVIMRPIRSVSGLPNDGQFRAGVQLTGALPQASGGQVPLQEVRFYKVAKLTMTSPVAVPPARQWAWASQASGQHLHSYPLILGTPAIQFPLTHFSEYIFSELDPLIVVDTPPIPGPTESQLQQAMAELILEERRRLLLGEPGDPDFAAKLEEILRAYYDYVIAPMLPSAEQDCNEIDYVLGKAWGWARMSELLGFGAGFASQIDTIQNSFIKSLENCWEELTKPCLNQNNPSEMARVVRLARTAQLLGLDPEKFDPFNTTPCDCTGVARVTGGWKAMLNYNWSQSASGPPSSSGLKGTESASARHAANVTAHLNTTEDPASGYWWGRLSGSAELYDRTDFQGGSYHTWEEMNGSGEPLKEAGIGAVEARVSFNAAQCTYSLWIPVWLNVRFTGPDTDFVLDTLESNFRIVNLPVRWTAQENNFVIEDTWRAEINTEREPVRLQINSHAEDYITWLYGEFPRTEVAWRIEPAVPPPPVQ